MKPILYDGSFDGFLCAVFDAYEYKYFDSDITTEAHFNGNIFYPVHQARLIPAHSERVWKGLERKLSLEAQKQIRQAFLSEIRGMENTLFHYIQYIFSTDKSVETDFSHPSVLQVVQTAKSVWREKHRMEAFVRFQKTADGLFYAIIQPDYNVLPLIAGHFSERYADQCWLIYDAKRRYGMYYDQDTVSEVKIEFAPEAGSGEAAAAVYDEKEELYQQLWQQYFSSVNIAARKNTRLHLQHMPRRYWKYLPEKKVKS
ncbi:MAG TPA: TIGR03915 family putative DNA repair protein [Flavisolibacter sp.]|jgi:probable DNA metabolism protein|nr:TIGR03915 family putative DNA repair protein [Flavisolibacter sp.]